MDRSALLVGLAAVGAALAFALGATAFTPTVDGSGGAVEDSSGSTDLGQQPASSSSAPAGRSAEASASSADGDCRTCSALNVRSLVAGALPAVDLRLLLAALAVALASLVRAGLLSNGDDAPVEGTSDSPHTNRSAESEPAPGTNWDLDAPPSNDVDRAWLAMVERIDVARPRVTTPREFARAATETAVPDDAVGQLTDLFETTRYGPTQATERHERAAREAAARIDAADERRDAGDR